MPSNRYFLQNKLQLSRINKIIKKLIKTKYACGKCCEQDLENFYIYFN